MVELIFFRILSENNSRKQDGMTYIENGAIPNVQRLILEEDSFIITYEVEFTPDELHSNETFCKDNIKMVLQQSSYVFIILTCSYSMKKVFKIPNFISQQSLFYSF